MQINAASMDTFVERLQALLEAREDAFREVQMATDGRATMNDFLKEIRPLVILITDVSFVIETDVVHDTINLCQTH